jgi:hypothetical protein
VRLSTRLLRLEQRVVDPGCPGRRDRRGRPVLVNVQELPDGTVTYPDDDEPKPCEQCGEIPEVITTIIMQVVKTREDVARLEAERRSGAT